MGAQFSHLAFQGWRLAPLLPASYEFAYIHGPCRRFRGDQNDEDTRTYCGKFLCNVIASSATTQVSSATTQVSGATTQVSSATTQVSSATTQVSSATTQVSIATTQVSSATTQVSSATTQVSSATTQELSFQWHRRSPGQRFV